MQKFPFILDEIGNEQRGRRFAIIIGRGPLQPGRTHSAAMAQALSEAGGGAEGERKAENESENESDRDGKGKGKSEGEGECKGWKGQAEAEGKGEDETFEDRINRLMESRKLLPNASYFAFTATPKNKTLEIFGEPDPQPQPDGAVRRRAFHGYAMKQAIQEGFILDVLAHYTPVVSYYKLAKTVEDDPEFDVDKARRSCGASSRATTTRSASRPRSWWTTSSRRCLRRTGSAARRGRWWSPTGSSAPSSTSRPSATTWRSARAGTGPSWRSRASTSSAGRR